MTAWSSDQRRAANAASEQLTTALAELKGSGLRPHCADGGDIWISDDDVDRQLAILACDGCPVLVECYEVGTFERYHVWGGVDRTRKQKKQQAA